MEKTIRKGKARADKHVRDSANQEEDVPLDLHAERERLIHERQDSVARVLERHDDLVRH